MLKIPILPADEAAAEIVRHFVNDRLIDMMRSIIVDEVGLDAIVSTGSAFEPNKRSFEELVDIDGLMQDMNFAENVSLMYLPEGYPVEKANREFLGLYKLLKAKKEYVPELPMEYVLNAVIREEIYHIDELNEDMAEGIFDEPKDDPFFAKMSEQEFTTVQHIREPERTLVLESLEKESYGEEFSAHEYLNTYEDLREYDETCFWDSDYAFLDKMSEDELIHSDMAKFLGIGERRDTKVMEISTDGKNKIKFEVNVPPWENED